MRDQHAVKWVFVVKRQGCRSFAMACRDGKFGKAEAKGERSDRGSQAEFACGVLDAEFPGGNRADEDLISGIADGIVLRGR